MRILSYILLMISCFGFQACSKPDAFPQVITYYEANGQANPDLLKRPSPVVVQLFQLKNYLTFNHADFNNLFSNAKTVLDSDLLSKDQVEIKPNQHLQTSQDLLSDTNYIGVIAAFRDIENSQWRSIIKIKNNKTIKLNVLLGSNEVEIKPVS